MLAWSPGVPLIHRPNGFPVSRQEPPDLTARFPGRLAREAVGRAVAGINRNVRIGKGILSQGRSQFGGGDRLTHVTLRMFRDVGQQTDDRGGEALATLIWHTYSPRVTSFSGISICTGTASGRVAASCLASMGPTSKVFTPFLLNRLKVTFTRRFLGLAGSGSASYTSKFTYRL